MSVTTVLSALLFFSFVGAAFSGTGCPAGPEDYYYALEPGCIANVGRCPNTACSIPDCDESRCCVPRSYDYIEVTCDGVQIPVPRVTKCGCDLCGEPRAFITGVVICAEGDDCTASFMEGGSTNPLGNSDEFRRFGFYVDYPPGERLMLTITADSYYPHFRVVNVIPDEHYYWIEVQLESIYAPQELNPTLLQQIPISETIGLIFPQNSITYENGDPLTGPAFLAFNLIDSTTTSPLNAPTELLVSVDPPEFLGTAGMLQIDLRDEAGVPLNADGAQLAVEVPSGVDLNIYTYNPVTGLWELTSELQAPARRRRGDTTFKIGELNVTVGQIYNLDQLLGAYCRVKVRFFIGEDFLVEEGQFGGSTVFGVYGELTDLGFLWLNYLRQTSGSSGVCLPIPCDNNVISSVAITASYYGQSSLLPVSDPAEAGVPPALQTAWSYTLLEQFILLTLPDGPLVDNVNGPLYSDHSACVTAPFEANHFRFYRESPPDMEMDVVPFDESDPFTPWDASLLSWWQDPTNFTACYIRVNLSMEYGVPCSEDVPCQSRRKRGANGSDSQGPVKVEVVSKGGTHPDTTDDEYGSRSSWSLGDFACIEYKCSGILIDGDPDRTKIEISVIHPPSNNYTLYLLSTATFSLTLLDRI